MQIMLTVKKIQGIANLTISTDLRFSKTLFQDIGRPCNLLISVNISTFYKWKAKTTSNSIQNTTVPINLCRSHIYLNSRTKCPLNNRQPSKWEKNYTQSSVIVFQKISIPPTEGFWKLFSLTVFQSWFLLLATSKIMLRRHICLSRISDFVIYM